MTLAHVAAAVQRTRLGRVLWAVVVVAPAVLAAAALFFVARFTFLPAFAGPLLAVLLGWVALLPMRESRWFAALPRGAQGALAVCGIGPVAVLAGAMAHANAGVWGGATPYLGVAVAAGTAALLARLWADPLPSAAGPRARYLERRPWLRPPARDDRDEACE